MANTVVVSNLLALKMAVEQFCPTMEFVQNCSHYRTWKDNHNGRLVGDWPLPEGWTAEQVGENAVHVIRKTNVSNRESAGAPYEIGIVPVRVTRGENGEVLAAVPDSKGTEYILMTDWYNDGNGILEEQGVGRRLSKTEVKSESAFGELFMHYRMMEAQLEAERLGDSISFEKQPDGSYVAEVDTRARLGC